jgi:hypothetical protein
MATSSTAATDQRPHDGPLDHPPGLLPCAVPCQPATCRGEWIEAPALDIAVVAVVRPYT